MLLDVRHLSVSFPSRRGTVQALRDVSFQLGAGEILGVVGESGCGKSTLCSSIVDILPRQAVIQGTLNYKGIDLRRIPSKEVRQLRGREIATVLQNPMTALDPLFTVGNQFDEILNCNLKIAPSQRRLMMLNLLDSVGIPEPDQRLKCYPHQLSGGMKQRFLVAMATALKPGILLADEPTTALDVTIQEQILHLLIDIRRRQDTAIILVTHDLGIVRRITDRLLIMYAGSVVETGPTDEVFARPLHPYTRALMDAIPTLDRLPHRLPSINGQIPDLSKLPSGCSFAPRCARATDACRIGNFNSMTRVGRSLVRCHLFKEQVA